MKTLPFLLSVLIASVSVFPESSMAAPVAETAAGGILWRKDNNVDAAFAEAKASGKPLFLYWGAAWCPPCNQVKATIFNRQEFIEKSRNFIPVYIDGDSPGAQKLGARFKVRGYPSMILFKPDGTEITRLPGEVDSDKYLQVLNLAMNTSLSAHDSLKIALSGEGKLQEADWALLANYSWDDPQQKLLPAKEIPASLLKAASNCPHPKHAQRLALRAYAAEAGSKTAAAIDKAQARATVLALLNNAEATRENFDILTNYAQPLLSWLSDKGTPERGELQSKWALALNQLADDAGLSKTDRIGALYARLQLLTLNAGLADETLREDLKKRVSTIEVATTDSYERQSVVSSAAYALSVAGLNDDAENLLKAELKRSHSPYYFMSTLGGLAKKRGDINGAADWYEQAYKASTGPATRLQWGSGYVTNLIDLQPDNTDRIEKAAQSVFSELGKVDNAFYDRNLAYLEKISKKLNDWNKDGSRQASVKKLVTQFDDVCKKLPAKDPQKAACQGIFHKGS